MCDLITFSVPQRVVVPPVAGGRNATFGVAPYTNAGGGHRYPAGFAAYALTAGGCSCGLYVTPEHEDARAKSAALEARYREKGWSEAKIARALRDHDASTTRKARIPGLTAPVVEYFLSVLQVSPVLHFILHYHHGSFNAERFALTAAVPLSESALRAGSPFPQYDHLYTVRRRAAG